MKEWKGMENISLLKKIKITNYGNKINEIKEKPLISQYLDFTMKFIIPEGNICTFKKFSAISNI